MSRPSWDRTTARSTPATRLTSSSSNQSSSFTAVLAIARTPPVQRLLGHLLVPAAARPGLERGQPAAGLVGGVLSIVLRVLLWLGPRWRRVLPQLRRQVLLASALRQRRPARLRELRRLLRVGRRELAGVRVERRGLGQLLGDRRGRRRRLRCDRLGHRLGRLLLLRRLRLLG